MLKRLARRLAARLLAWAGDDSPVVPPSDPARPATVADPVLGVLEFACFLAGVDTSRFSPALDLSQSGKVPEVIYITARELGPSHRLQTVGAIAAAFRHE